LLCRHDRAVPRKADQDRQPVFPSHSAYPRVQCSYSARD
jgi:hypothetical protein